MTIETTHNPFHAGELEAQKRAGVGDVAAKVAGFIRSYMPEQHRQFYTSLPFLVVSAADGQGRPWVTILEGEDGFVSSPDPETLAVTSNLDPQDPLFASFEAGTDIGLLGIELATRRRNRLSGAFRKTASGYAIDIRQSFGNCPQYIREREWHRVTGVTPGDAIWSDALNEAHMDRIRQADTMFIGTGQRDADNKPANGYDASHRGGEPGFVQIVDATRLRIPDYAGNNFFNTIGNLLQNPRIGLLFVDFETGGLLQITGRAEIDWQPKDAADPAARRMIDVTIDAVVDRPSAVSLRWDGEGQQVRQLALVKKVEEAQDITSFYLAPVDGRRLAPFKAGQHLPIELQLAEPLGKARRTYSLSAASNGKTYRLSIKREAKGLVSRVMHDLLQRGDVIEARSPSGDFVLPAGDCPVVLASAGVGITPTMAMLEEIAKEAGDRPAWFVHGARNGRSHAMRREVDAIAEAHPNITRQVFYSRPKAEDRIGLDYDHQGRVSAEGLLGLNAGPKAHYLLCGPAAFVAEIQAGLEAQGVPQNQIHFETF
ncbi:MAG: pyridoxamine 5'-phosphate oxidase family protein [Pseudomonadota bacterium]